MSNVLNKKHFNKKQQVTLVEILPINCLKIAQYQSPCNALRVKRIVDNYNEELLQPIDVSYRDYQYWIVDGQHRVEALKKKNIPNISCRIHHGLTYQKEANIYEALNNPKNRRTPRAVQRANARIEGGDPVMLEIKKIVESNGFELGLDEYKKINKIIAVTTLEKIYENIGPSGLNRVLYLIHGAWNGIYEAVDVALLQGLYLFVKNYNDDFKDKDFIDKMSRVSPKEIIADGKANKQYSRSTYTPYGLAIMYHFNKGKNKKLPNKF